MNLKGSKTEQNLLKSFAGESQARNRYEFFAKVAKNEGFEQISAIFMETSLQEKEHGKRFFKFLEGGDVEITASYPAGIIGTTSENLEAAAKGEHEEWEVLYAHFAEVAKEEGFDEISNCFNMVAKVEAEHEKRYLALLKNVKEEKVFKKDVETYWMCRNCGYIHFGKSAPVKCPACQHPQAYFEVKAYNY